MLALLLALIIAGPARFNRESRVLRAANLTLTGLLSVANAWSTTVLVVGILTGRLGQDAAPLLSTAAAILADQHHRPICTTVVHQRHRLQTDRCDALTPWAKLTVLAQSLVSLRVSSSSWPEP